MASSIMTSKPVSHAAITGFGTYVPERILDNHELEHIVQTSDEWIVQRTGIHERRIAADDEYTSDLCLKAVKNMTDRYGKTVDDVDLILVSTTTPDYPFPSVACLVQSRLGIRNTGAIDLSAACAGFVYGLQLANGMISAGLHKKILVIGAETLSKVTDYSDRATCILFGDGAGAALVERVEKGAFLASHVGSEGEEGRHLYRTGIRTSWNGDPLQDSGMIIQNGREVYKWAVNTLSHEIPYWLEQAGFHLDNVDWFIPHSANIRILESVCERISFPMEKTLFSGELYGNTSSATIPLALDIGLREGKVKTGDHLLLYGFGGGLVHAGVLLQWTL